MQRIRCAIYVRKSTEKGLELEFNSLHNQCDACKNYILSQAFQGWEFAKTYVDSGIQVTKFRGTRKIVFLVIQIDNNSQNQYNNIMKNTLLILTLILYSCTGTDLSKNVNYTNKSIEQKTRIDLTGKWLLNNADGHFGGEIIVKDCNDKQCDMKLQSWYDLHICEADGKIVFKNNDIAEYTSKKYIYDNKTNTESSVPVGIVFKILPDGNMSLHYSNTNSYSAFCGMNATVEGTWVKTKLSTP